MKNLSNHIIRSFLCVVVGLFFFFSGNAQINIDYPEQEKDLDKAKELVLAYESGDWETLRQLTAEDATFYNLGTYDSLDIDGTIEYWTKGRKTATPVLSDDGTWLAVEVPEGPRQGRWVLHWGENTLNYANGDVISFPYHVALKYDEDKVGEAHFYYDNNRIVRALGFEIQPPLNENEEDNQEDY